MVLEQANFSNALPLKVGESPWIRELYRKLRFLIKALSGQRVCLELRNGSAVYGQIEQVDKSMNINLESAVVSHNVAQSQTSHQDMESDKRTVPFSQLYIPGRQIVFVHISDEVYLVATLDKEVSVFHGPHNVFETHPSCA